MTGPSVFYVCTNYYTPSYSSLPFAKLRWAIDRRDLNSSGDPRQFIPQGMEFALNIRHSPAMYHQN
ncbi:MAG: hypothetical protein V2J65_14505 [Desulfobacteraceae bacterium]|nr:hypothetical protein [Desulfobacteraceae bacterium]